VAITTHTGKAIQIGSYAIDVIFSGELFRGAVRLDNLKSCLALVLSSDRQAALASGNAAGGASIQAQGPDHETAFCI
jgi:hypothetical protein